MQKNTSVSYCTEIEHIQVSLTQQCEHYLHEVNNFIQWTPCCINGEPHGIDHFMAHYNAHGKLDEVKCKCEGHNVFGKSLDDRYVPSVCDISGLSISGRQFFPCERIRQGDKMFDITFTIAVMGNVLIKHSCNSLIKIPCLI